MCIHLDCDCASTLPVPTRRPVAGGFDEVKLAVILTSAMALSSRSLSHVHISQRPDGDFLIQRREHNRPGYPRDHWLRAGVPGWPSRTDGIISRSRERWFRGSGQKGEAPPASGIRCGSSREGSGACLVLRHRARRRVFLFFSGGWPLRGQWHLCCSAGR